MTAPGSQRPSFVRAHSPTVVAALAMLGWLAAGHAFVYGADGTGLMLGGVVVLRVLGAAIVATLVGAVTLGLVGALRLVRGVAPGDARDPERQLAEKLPLVGLRGVGWALVAAFAVNEAAQAFSLHSNGGWLLIAGLATLIVSRQLQQMAPTRPAPRPTLFLTNRWAVRAASLTVGLLAFSALLEMSVSDLRGYVSLFDFAALPLILLACLARPRVEIGSDGMYIRSLRRFVRWRGDEAIFIQDGWLAVQRDGKTVARLAPPHPLVDVEALAPQLAASIAGAKADPVTAKTVATLEARAATQDEALRTGAHGYRVAGVSREELWRVVETSALPVRVRVEAARELAVDPQEGDDQRLLEVAERAADPVVRKQLALPTGSRERT